MRVQINDAVEMKKVGKFVGRKSVLKSLHICAREVRGRGVLIFAFSNQSIEIRGDVQEYGSVEVDKSLFGRIFDSFTVGAPVEVWVEGDRLRFRQKNFLIALNILNEKHYDMFATSSNSMRKNLIRQERQMLLARLSVIDKELRRGG